jgi:hypothetical protein
VPWFLPPVPLPNVGTWILWSRTNTTSLLTPRARISAIARQARREDSRRNGNDNQLWVSAESVRHSINSRFYHEPTAAQPPSSFAEGLELDMHELWHLFYQARCMLPPPRPAHAVHRPLTRYPSEHL